MEGGGEGAGGLVGHVARSVNEMRRASGTVGTKAAMNDPGYPVWTEAAVNDPGYPVWTEEAEVQRV